MTSHWGKSSKNLKIWKRKNPKINPDPNGNSSLNLSLSKKLIKIVNKEPIRIIDGKLKGPTIDPNPPKSNISPPPIPSFFFINLYKIFINQRRKNPIKKP